MVSEYALQVAGWWICQSKKSIIHHDPNSSRLEQLIPFVTTELQSAMIVNLRIWVRDLDQGKRQHPCRQTPFVPCLFSSTPHSFKAFELPPRSPIVRKTSRSLAQGNLNISLRSSRRRMTEGRNGFCANNPCLTRGSRTCFERHTFTAIYSIADPNQRPELKDDLTCRL